MICGLFVTLFKDTATNNSKCYCIISCVCSVSLQRVCVCVCAELEASKRRLLDSEREKSELASLAQQRLKELEQLHRWACVGGSHPPRMRAPQLL